MTYRWTAVIPAVALGLATLVPALAGTATASAAAATCGGKPATLTDEDAFHDEDDTLILNGTEGPDVIVIAGDTGISHVWGNGGDDLICQTSPYLLNINGGPGSDTIHGGSGPTKYDVVASADTNDAGPGDIDHIHDAGGNDELTVYVEGGSATIDVPNHRVTGVNLDMTWHHRIEKYVSKGNSGTTFLGGPSTDRYTAEGTDGVVRGGGGHDDLTARQPADVRAGAGNDLVNVYTLDHTPATNQISAGTGDDSVTLGGSGLHHVSTGAGDDVVRSSRATAEVRASLGSGHDKLYFAGAATAAGGGGNDTFYPYAAPDGAVRAVLDGSAGTNRVNFFRLRTGVKARLDKARAVWGNNVVTLVHLDRVTGTKYADKLIGNAAANHLAGGAGKDRLAGKAGRDTLTGGSGRDRAHGGPGRDRCSAERRVSC